MTVSLRPALVFVAALFTLVATTNVARLTVPALSVRAASNIALAERPGADYYLAHDRGGHLDHHVLYHGTDAEAIEHLKRADILFVGTSRLMFALRSRVVTPWAEQHGLRYYALGFGHRDGDEWVRELIERHDLRPQLVVTNIDGFFARRNSAWANRGRRDSAFGARQAQLEGEIGHQTRRVMQRLIPNWLDVYGRPGMSFGNEFIAYRSRINGVWSISSWPPATGSAPAADYGAAEVGPRVATAARDFKAQLDRRGARLILTHVPTPDATGDNPVALGTLLGVPAVGLDVDGLTSHDGSHLSEESAVTWSRRVTGDLTPYLSSLRPR